ncbi:hypothetical protein [Microbacterium sp. cf332]|uniref:hypothetical protein n=1 Tax=Microbacterium sp. cf332 TaxID=1761804 RepID=UPI00088DB851|nr:hypothetical protein [Microbacterium sp. cf332]SDQ53357.1 hypothetical protein SAMN04487847_1750 [Microbacterium sp. cf332]
MTLTSLLPTLRRSIPSPHARDAWPARTVVTCDDVVVCGISAQRFVELCGLPAVMTAPAVIPLSGGMASATATTTVLLLRVMRGPDDGSPTLVVDADLDAAGLAVWGEARLLNRVSSAHDQRIEVGGADRERLTGASVVLPADVRGGDVIAVPCAGALGVGDVRPHPAARPHAGGAE